MVETHELIAGIVVSIALVLWLMPGTITGHASQPAQSCVDCAPRCGDGITQTPEQCDDGNTINEDGCSASCLIEPRVQQAAVAPVIPPPDMIVQPVRVPSNAARLTMLVNGSGLDKVTAIGATYLGAREVSYDTKFGRPLFVAFEVQTDASSSLFDVHVSDEWLTAQRIEPSQVMVYSYDGSWQPLSTPYVKQDATNAYYQASTASSGLFVISYHDKIVPLAGPVAPVAPPALSVKTPIAEKPAVPPTATPKPASQPQQNGSLNFTLGITLLIIVSVAFGAFMLFHHPVQSARASSPDLDQALDDFSDAAADGDKTAAKRALDRAERLMDSQALRSSYSARVQEAFSELKRL